VKLSTHDYLYKPLILCESFISSKYRTWGVTVMELVGASNE
jgi:hypothetical protein